MQQPKIVIIGAGFGGLFTYRDLQRRFQGKAGAPKITVISKTNYFLFTPLLHEVATGSVNRSNIVQPIRQVLGNACHDLVVGEANEIDLTKREVHVNGTVLPFDFLVLAHGATTNLRDFDPKLVYTLKDIDDASKLKNKIIELFEQANKISDEAQRSRLLTFVVIGGGATGVELAAEVQEFVGTLAKLFPRLSATQAKVILLHKDSELIPHFKPRLRKKTLELLQKKGVRVMLGRSAAKISEAGLDLDDGSHIASAMPILVSGIQATPLNIRPAVAKNIRGQIEVNEFLQIPSFPNVFVLGDAAGISQGGKTVPQTAQAAEAEAAYAERNLTALILGKPLLPFAYKERGQLLSVGRWTAVADIYGLGLVGHFAWWVWRTIYASKLIGWENRIRVVLDWTIDIFYPRDISKFE